MTAITARSLAVHIPESRASSNVGGTHSGKSGVVEDRKMSKTGHVTVTVRQDDGVRLKTLARNVVVQQAS